MYNINSVLNKYAFQFPHEGIPIESLYCVLIKKQLTIPKITLLPTHASEENNNKTEHF